MLYVLRNLEKMDDASYWKEALPKLVVFLGGLPFEGLQNEGLQVGHSVTEWEVKTALQLEKDRSRVFWMHRVFESGVKETDKSFWDYNDTLQDAEKAAKLSNLIEWMKEEIPMERIREYKGASLDSYRTDDGTWRAQKQQWVQDMTEQLTASLDAVMKEQERGLEH